MFDPRTSELMERLHLGGGHWCIVTLPDGRQYWDGDEVPSDGNVYFSVHTYSATTRQDKYLSSASGVVADFDAKDFAGDMGKALVATQTYTPSVIVNSGGGYHAYWLLSTPFQCSDEGDRDRFRRLQKAWAKHVGSDPAAALTTQLLRVPGTSNSKYDPPRPVEIVEWHPERTFDIEALEDTARPLAFVERSRPARKEGRERSVIDAFNEAHSVADIIAEYGYTISRDGRYFTRPGKTQGVSGYLCPETLYSFSSNDPLSTGHQVDAFEAFRILKFKGDTNAAVKAAATEFGLAGKRTETSYRNPEVVSTATSPGTIAGSAITETPVVISGADNRSETAAVPIQTNPGPDPLVAAHLTDAGNAECLVHLHGADLRFCHDTRSWHIWNGAVWATDRNQEAVRRMRDTVKARYDAAWNIADTDSRRKIASWALASENVVRREAALRTAQSDRRVSINIEAFDTAAMLATARNGITINLATGQTFAARREDLITKTLGTNYDPNAKCPRWHQHLNEVFGGNADMIAYVKRAVGYSLTGDIREQKVFILHGTGANGKSVTLTVFRKLLGDYGDNTPFDTFDAGTAEARQDLAKMKGSRLVTVVETNEDRRLNEARIKAVTGGDQISARALYQSPFDYQPTFKLWVALNHLPIIKGTDPGIWRRIHLVAFNQSFEGREDKTLEATLLAELPGILNWAIEGALEWHSKGLAEPEEVKQATADYRQTMDLVRQWLDDCILTDPKAETEAGAAYQSYGQWCSTGGYRPETQGAFGRRMTEKRITKLRRGGKFYYQGIRLTTRGY